MATSISSAHGVFISDQGFCFTAALDAAVAGSTHYTLQDGIYNVWASAPFLLYLTDAVTDPAAIPALPPAVGSYTGILWPANNLLQFQMDRSILVTGGTVTPTGVRVVKATATAGTFFMTMLSTRFN